MSRRIYYGWVVLAACFLLTLAGTTILVNCIGIFIKPVSADLGFSRGSFALFYTFANVATMLISPWMGTVLRTKDQRKVIAICSLGAAMALVGYTFCVQLWQFYIVGFVCGLFTSGLTSMCVSSLISKWFVKKRATAIGIAFAGSGIGSMVLNPLTSSLIESGNWKLAFMVLAGILVLVNIPVALLLVVNRPSDIGLEPYGAGESGQSGAVVETSISKPEAMRLPYFWMLAVGMFFSGLIGTGMQQHINAYLTDIGHSAAFAAGIFALVMGCLTFSKLLLGWVFDRLGAIWGSALVFGTLAVSCILFLFAASPVMAYLFGVVFGVAYCVLSVPPSCLTLDMLGPDDYSANYGVISMFLCAGMSLGSPLSAFFFDTFGSYRYAWILYALTSAGTLVLLICTFYGVNRYKRSKLEAA